MKPNPIVVYIVVGTLAFVLIDYALTLSICALRGASPPLDLMGYLKDIGLFAGGSLATLLARTGQHPDEPTPVKNVNTPSDPVITEEIRNSKVGRGKQNGRKPNNK